jgi:hypothetical protein
MSVTHSKLQNLLLGHVGRTSETDKWDLALQKPRRKASCQELNHTWEVKNVVSSTIPSDSLPLLRGSTNGDCKRKKQGLLNREKFKYEWGY